MLLVNQFIMKSKLLFLFSIVFIAFQSCQKSTEIVVEDGVPPEFQSIKADNGMLVFSSHSHFLETMAQWNSMDENEVVKALASFDFLSYHSDTTLSKEIEVHPDLLLQKVINNKGAVKVNDTIFVLTVGEELIIKDADLDVYNSVITGDFSSKKVERFPVKNNIQSQDIELFHTVPNTWYGENQYYSPEEADNGRPERVRTTLYASTSALYPACGLKVKGEAHRRCGLWCVDWRADEVNQLNILANSSFKTNYFTAIRSIPAGSVYDTEETTVFAFPSPGGTAINGEHFGFQSLQVHLSYKKKAHNPLRKISLYVNNGVLQPATVNW